MGTLVTALTWGFIIGASTATLESFDYVIVGAGTSGLVVARRLSEDPAVTVAVIEPGTDQRHNANVTTTNGFGQSFGTPIDWAYNTVKQSEAGNREFGLHAGKAWGGTSTLNGMTYIRGNVAEFDAWELLGNPGWDWAALFPYFKKSERYTVPSGTQLAAGATYQSRNHGFVGPLHVGYTAALRNGSFAQPVIQTWESLSLQHNPDLNSGNVRGFGMGPQTLDRELDVRFDAARAYYHSVEHRPNLKILRGTVKRIIWDGGRRKHSEPLVAKGVEFVTKDSKLSTVGAKKEVVLSAGALRTPLVLEASGIGNPKILKALGIETRVILPGVGENLVEQPAHFLTFAGDPGVESAASAYHTYVTAADLFGNKVGAVEQVTRASLSKWAQAAVDASGPGYGSLDMIRAVEKLLGIHHDLLFKHNGTAGEIITAIAPAFPGDSFATLASNYWLLLPFSRGSVHLKSLQKINEPLINPRIFLADFDISALTAVGRIADRFWFSEPMRSWSLVTRPKGSPLPNNATDAQWDAHLRKSVVANSHPTGTAAMMSRELGGVVDPELKVYGTANVRVVDASIIPTQISGHLTAALYAVAERASDIIKRNSKGHH